MKAYLLSVILLFGVFAFGDDLNGIILTTDRTVDVTSNAGILKSTITDDMNPQQKSYALWRFFIQRNMHKERAKLLNHGNAAELMTKTAYCLCGSWGHHYAGLATDAGLTASTVYLNGHVVAAVQYWNDWHLVDADMWCLYPQADGVLASPSEIRRDKNPDGSWKYKAGPPVKPYPWYIGPDSIEGVVGMYSKASVNKPYTKHPWKWQYELNLKPGMEISWSWYPDSDVGYVSLSHVPDVRNPRKHKSLREYLEDDYDYYARKDGKPKWHWGGRRGGLRPNPLQAWNGTGGNGRLTFDLGRAAWAHALDMMSARENIAVKNGRLGLTDPALPGSFVLDFTIPYQYGDAWIEGPLPDEGLKIELSKDGRNFKEVFPKGSLFDGQHYRLFEAVRGLPGFQLRVSLEPGAEGLGRFRAIGAFDHAYTALPALLKGQNDVAIRLKNGDSLKDTPLHVTYVYNQLTESRDIYRYERTLTFMPDTLTWGVDMGDRHWPLMREIRMRAGGSVPPDPAPAPETGELDWGAYPWDWVYHGVNFWNDFERGDRQGWRAALTTKKTFGGSDFALNNSLMTKEGDRQLKMIRYGACLNRDTKFRCEVYVKNVKDLRFYTRDQSDRTYPEITVRNLKDGEWQTFEVAYKDLKWPDDPERLLEDGAFMAAQYLVVTPAEGKSRKDVEFYIDNIICYDGELKYDPFKDPNAPLYALTDDPIWNAKPPKAE